MLSRSTKAALAAVLSALALAACTAPEAAPATSSAPVPSVTSEAAYDAHGVLVGAGRCEGAKSDVKAVGDSSRMNAVLSSKATLQGYLKCVGTAIGEKDFADQILADTVMHDADHTPAKRIYTHFEAELLYPSPEANTPPMLVVTSL